METTDYQAKYFAYALTREGESGVERLQQSLLNAAVDLNPHQVDAALFALRSPLSKGVLLADEVGLGKTIEAGLVLCQYWAERRRNLLVVCPASLRKQWQCELTEKFNLPAEVVDAPHYRQLVKSGTPNPFSRPVVSIVSYAFAAKMQDEIKIVPWNCVVMDEAHKLRNAYRASNKMGTRIRFALKDRPKILLSATPIQNNLTELYGISTLIDEDLFGDLASFRTRYTNVGGDIAALRLRMKEFAHRTLRKDVSAYVRYTNRHLLTQTFEATAQEMQFYDDVSDYLQDEEAYAFPEGQHHLLTLLVRKLLSSSPLALAGTFEQILVRLKELRSQQTILPHVEMSFDEEERGLIEELRDDLEEMDNDEGEAPLSETGARLIDKNLLEREIGRVETFIKRAYALQEDTKAKSLLTALETGWQKLEALGAQRKAVIFTESVRTMNFLSGYLKCNGYEKKVVSFSGGRVKDPYTNEIYEQYKASHPNGGSRGVMFRHAVVENFRDEATILIATEAGAEGINLQFCSMVVNYDLPWNPQRIEQRIGRCHRYGQKHDVVVVNFLNQKNAADARVFELLNEKFNLFSGVFGASNDILGALDASGASLENRIHAIFQKCRTPAEIAAAFDSLQKEYAEIISARRERTRNDVLENFDDDVLAHLKGMDKDARTALDRWSERFRRLATKVIGSRADFSADGLTFDLKESPAAQIPLGRYDFRVQGEDLNAIRMRPNTPLGEWAVAEAKERQTTLGEVTFSISDYVGKISVLEKLKGKSGWLTVRSVRFETLADQDVLLVSALTDDGKSIDHEISEKFFDLPAHAVPLAEIPPPLAEKLSANIELYTNAEAARIDSANKHYLQEKSDQLDRLTDDKIAVVQNEIDALKAEERALRRDRLRAETVEAQFALEKKLRDVRKSINRKRTELYTVQDESDEQNELILAEYRKKLTQKRISTDLFTIRWRLI